LKERHTYYVYVCAYILLPPNFQLIFAKFDMNVMQLDVAWIISHIDDKKVVDELVRWAQNWNHVIGV